jgi:hypothetical protein
LVLDEKEERLALVDTGSPFDIGRGRAARLLDENWCPPVEHARVLDVASTHLGVEVEWLLGAPTLERLRLLLDWRGRRAELRADAIALDGARPVSIVRRGGVPFVEIVAGSATTAAVLVPRAAVAGRTPIRRERDFHPLIGPFETDVWSLPISVDGRPIALEAGVLPAALERALATGDGWILGSDFFCNRTIVLDYPAATVWDAP